MERQTWRKEVAACTIKASHRRDHQHDAVSDVCHPHAVEVVHLGDQALMVCHDCAADTGFIAHREAERLAAEHREQTRADVPPSAGPDAHAA